MLYYNMYSIPIVNIHIGPEGHTVATIVIETLFPVSLPDNYGFQWAFPCRSHSYVEVELEKVLQLLWLLLYISFISYSMLCIDMC